MICNFEAMEERNVKHRMQIQKAESLQECNAKGAKLEIKNIYNTELFLQTHRKNSILVNLQTEYWFFFLTYCKCKDEHIQKDMWSAVSDSTAHSILFEQQHTVTFSNDAYITRHC